MKGKFNWSSDDSVCFSSASGVAVYVNEHGHIVIRQESAMGEDDSFIIFPPEMAPKVVAAIRGAQKIAKEL